MKVEDNEFYVVPSISNINGPRIWIRRGTNLFSVIYDPLSEMCRWGNFDKYSTKDDHIVSFEFRNSSILKEAEKLLMKNGYKQITQ